MVVAASCDCVSGEQSCTVGQVTGLVVQDAEVCCWSGAGGHRSGWSRSDGALFWWRHRLLINTRVLLQASSEAALYLRAAGRRWRSLWGEKLCSAQVCPLQQKRHRGRSAEEPALAPQTWRWSLMPAAQTHFSKLTEIWVNAANQIYHKRRKRGGRWPFVYLRGSWSGTGAHGVSFQRQSPELHTTAQIPQLSQIFKLVLLQIQQLQVLQQTDWTQIWDAVEGHIQLLNKNQQRLWRHLRLNI